MRFFTIPLLKQKDRAAVISREVPLDTELKHSASAAPDLSPPRSPFHPSAGTAGTVRCLDQSPRELMPGSFFTVSLTQVSRE